MPKQTSSNLLNMLYHDARSPLTRLSEALGALHLKVSRQRIGQYIAQLEAEQKITYSIVENPNVHEFRTFFIEIKTNPEEPEIVSNLQGLHHVRSIDGIIGQYSIIAKFCARDDQQFSEILGQIDHLITGTRFQHYKILNIIKTYKDGGMTLFPPGSIDHDGGNRGLNIDVIDEQLLDILQDMPQQYSYDQIAQLTIGPGLSNSQVFRRVRRMEDVRVIHAFTIKIAPILIPLTDFPLKFYLQILPKRLSEYDAIAVETLAPKDEIVELYRTGEEYGLLAVARTGGIAQYRSFLESLYKTGKIQDTVSTLVIDEKLPAIFKPFRCSI